MQMQRASGGLLMEVACDGGNSKQLMQWQYMRHATGIQRA